MNQKRLSRRSFLKSSVAVAAFVSSGSLAYSSESAQVFNNAPVSPLKIPGWRRGHLHQHSFWSDGSATLEEACSLYRDAGYEFVIPSDHGRFQADTDKWFTLEGGKKAAFERGQERYKFPMETKEEDGKLQLCMRNFDEISALLNQEDRFLLIPGHELTTHGADGVQVHSNLINSREEVTQELVDKLEGQAPAMFMSRPITGDKTTPRCSGYEAVGWSLQAHKEMIGNRPKDEVVVMFNHPDWIWYDLQPEWLCEQPEIRFFELVNCGPNLPVRPDFWTMEKYWDIINAFRADRNQPLIMATATDDTHNYQRFYNDFETAAGGSVMVRCDSLDAVDLMRAMNRGDFYAAVGVWLDDIQFDKSTGTLAVDVHAEQDVNYKIDFIGTRRGFDKAFTTIDSPKEGKFPARKINTYSESVGEIFKTVEGTHAEYTMTDDDLYVRARITAMIPARCTMRGKPEHPSAWTQPVQK